MNPGRRARITRGPFRAPWFLREKQRYTGGLVLASGCGSIVPARGNLPHNLLRVLQRFHGGEQGMTTGEYETRCDKERGAPVAERE